MTKKMGIVEIGLMIKVQTMKMLRKPLLLQKNGNEYAVYGAEEIGVKMGHNSRKICILTSDRSVKKPYLCLSPRKFLVGVLIGQGELQLKSMSFAMNPFPHFYLAVLVLDRFQHFDFCGLF